MKYFTSIFIYFAVVNTSFAQPFSNLVLEGAGVRGLAYVGAIKYLEETQQLGNIEKVAGTSAGAIAALAISLGYTAEEIENLILGLKLQKFNDGRFFFIGGIARMNQSFGWYRGIAFTNWLEDIIKSKTGDANITFQDLHEKRFKDLYITGTSINNQRLLVFSHETYPLMKVKDAVRISMSIPLYFQALAIDTEGKVIDRRKINSSHDIVVDGGLTGNFPITLFDSISNISSQRIFNDHTIGLRIDSPEQIKYDSLNTGLAPIRVERFNNFVGAFYNYVIENLNRQALTPEDWSRTVSISSGSIGPKIRKLTTAEKVELILNGYNAMKQFTEHSR